MRGKAFFKKVESDPHMLWRGAKLESRADDAFVRIVSKRTGATYQISGAAVKRLTAKELDALMLNQMPKDVTGVQRIIVDANTVFPWSWCSATCLAVCVAKYAEPVSESEPPKEDDRDDPADSDGDGPNAEDVDDGDDDGEAEVGEAEGGEEETEE